MKAVPIFIHPYFWVTLYSPMHLLLFNYARNFLLKSHFQHRTQPRALAVCETFTTVVQVSTFALSEDKNFHPCRNICINAYGTFLKHLFLVTCNPNFSKFNFFQKHRLLISQFQRYIARMTKNHRFLGEWTSVRTNYNSAKEIQSNSFFKNSSPSLPGNFPQWPRN